MMVHQDLGNSKVNVCFTGTILPFFFLSLWIIINISFCSQIILISVLKSLYDTSQIIRQDNNYMLFHVDRRIFFVLGRGKNLVQAVRNIGNVPKPKYSKCKIDKFSILLIKNLYCLVNDFFHHLSLFHIPVEDIASSFKSP